jgi:hypothetical protein
MIRDRAEVVATAIIKIIQDALRNRFAGGSAAALADARAAIVAYLRDELDDVMRQTRDDLRLRDD